MIYRDNNVLGKPLSRVVFGGAAVSGEGGGYGFGSMDEESAEKILKLAWDSGINFFDTAPIYGFGLSEERFGRYLPKEAVIVSKAGVDWHPNRRVNMSNDPKIVEKMLRESLKRLRRDFIDVYMIHWPDKHIDIRRPLEVLRKYQEKSVIGELGLCNTNLEDLKLAQDVAPITFVQSELNVLNTRAFDQLQDHWKNYFSMGWGTFDKGILSGSVTQERTFDTSDARSWAPWWNKKEVAQKIEKVQKLKTILVEYNISLSQFCLNYSLNHYGLASCLIGIKTLDHLNDVQSHLQHPLEEQTMKEVINRWNN